MSRYRTELSTGCSLVAFARPSPCGQTGTRKEDPYSTSTDVDSFKLLFKRNLR